MRKVKLEMKLWGLKRKRYELTKRSGYVFQHHSFLGVLCLQKELSFLRRKVHNVCKRFAVCLNDAVEKSHI